MQKIPINLAAAGMKLAKPVTKEGGMTIMAEGMELTDSLISRLEAMKIDRITVQGHPVDMGGAGSGTKWGERKDRLDYLFRKHADDKWMTRVKDRMGQYFQIKAAAQEAKMQAMKSIESNEDEAEVENGGSGA
ncbi:MULTISPECIES: hypothetical protein [unclassified Pseudodesulfovibrio]|uniref:hypothetical protein n=1 Tax=unclassified Pseudodesulfovibrio TaxID=2661612 RepID=UPI000FEC13F0|nr:MULTISPECIES: hypothetical protein [unclassified Pseudodesulfovibrio]MCJ2163295.1 hypothetical protein [Pseudodesulfovibrio sp. S3-i]RWU07274.1 hypothetical protein DWB63_01890 [Pseudodesulfovibrio sp. S3]